MSEARCLTVNQAVGPRRAVLMATSEDYRQMANRSAQLAIACSTPSVAQALLALALDYMALAAQRGQAAAGRQQHQHMHQDPAGFGD